MGGYLGRGVSGEEGYLGRVRREGYLGRRVIWGGGLSGKEGYLGRGVIWERGLSGEEGYLGKRVIWGGGLSRVIMGGEMFCTWVATWGRGVTLLHFIRFKLITVPRNRNNSGQKLPPNYFYHSPLPNSTLNRGITTS